MVTEKELALVVLETHVLVRRRSRKNVDQFIAKQAPRAQAPRGSRGMLPQEIFQF